MIEPAKTPSPVNTKYYKKALPLLAIVLLVALPIRLYLVTYATAVSRDTVRFVEYAKQLRTEPLQAIQEHDQPPLYPAMIAASHSLLSPINNVFPTLKDPVASWSAAAVKPALIGGLALVIAAYCLARVLFDHRVGLYAALLSALAAEFCQLSADGLSDMPHLSLYLFALAAGIHGLQQKRFHWLAACGLLSGLAYLIRPEGAEAALAVAAGIAFFIPRWTFRQRLISLLTISAAALALAAPFMLITGKLIQKKSLEKFLIGNNASCIRHEYSLQLRIPKPNCKNPKIQLAGTSPTDHQKGFIAVSRILENWGRSLRYTLFLPAIAWLVLRRGLAGQQTGQRVVLFNLALHWLVLLALILRFDYLELFSLRHVMILAGLTLPFSAAGVVAVIDTIPWKRRKLFSGILLIALVAPTLPWMLETPHGNVQAIRRAGEYIRSISQSSPRILTDRHRAAYYANGQHLYMPKTCPPKKALQLARRKNADFLVFEPRRALAVQKDFFQTLETALQPDESLRRHDIKIPDSQNGSQTVIYRFHHRGN